MTTQSLAGKTAVVTGATSGIGAVVARELAARGARLLIVARDPQRAQATLAALPASPARAHAAHIADLSSLSDVKRVAAEIADQEAAIDILINNAGGVFPTRQVTADGLEQTFALNHMSYFILTLGLLDRIKAAPQGRVVSTASRMHASYSLDFSDLQLAKRYNSYVAYGRSKLCNILWTRELARRFEGSGVTANCLHPGFVATRFGDRSGGLMQAIMPLAKLMAISPQKGAETIVHLASSPEVAAITGQYFYKCKPIEASPEARDDGVAAWLWARSAKLAEAVEPAVA